MAVTATNLILGAGTLYTGVFGTSVEPTDLNINLVPAASGWTDCGATEGGVKFSVDQKFATLSCDQLIDDVGSRLTGRTVMFDTNLAEPTLANLTIAVNGGTAATGANFASLDALNTTAASQVPYFPAILDGFAPATVNNTWRARVIIRKAVNISKVESSWSQDKQTYIPVSFKSHFVSAAITPFRWIYQTA